MLSLLLILATSGMTYAQEPVLIPVKSRVGGGDRGKSGKGRAPEYVPVYQYGKDDWRPAWQPELPKPAAFDAGKSVKKSAAGTSQDTLSGVTKRRRQTQGFRIQLADVLSEDQARLIEARARNLFDTIYITFRNPNYRVRAGDFTRRADADRAAEEARMFGFRGAWVVPDRVFVEE